MIFKPPYLDVIKGFRMEQWCRVLGSIEIYGNTGQELVEEKTIKTSQEPWHSLVNSVHAKIPIYFQNSAASYE